MQTNYFAVSAVAVVIAIVSTASLFVLRRRGLQTWTGTAAGFQRNFRLQQWIWVNLGISDLVTLYSGLAGHMSIPLLVCVFLASVSAASVLLGLLCQNMSATNFAIADKYRVAQELLVPVPVRRQS